MNTFDFTNYWTPAAINLFGVQSSDGAIHPNLSLDAALGITVCIEFFERAASDDFPMDEELKRLLVLLAGPHGKALLKAYRIQKGLEHDQ